MHHDHEKSGEVHDADEGAVPEGGVVDSTASVITVTITIMGLALFVERRKDRVYPQVHVLFPHDHHHTGDNRHEAWLFINKKFTDDMLESCDFHEVNLAGAIVSIRDRNYDEYGRGATLAGFEKFSNLTRHVGYRVSATDHLQAASLGAMAQARLDLLGGSPEKDVDGAIWTVDQTKSETAELVPSVNWVMKFPVGSLPEVHIRRGTTINVIPLKPGKEKLHLLVVCSPHKHIFEAGWSVDPPKHEAEPLHFELLEHLTKQKKGDQIQLGHRPRFESGSLDKTPVFRLPDGCSDSGPSSYNPLEMMGVDPYNCIIGTACPDDEPDCG